MGKHAVFSPSSAHRWMACIGSVALTKDLPNKSSDYSREGTAAHMLAAEVMQDGSFDTTPRINSVIEVEGHPIKIDPDIAEGVQTYVDSIRQYASPEGSTLFVEVEVPIDHLTGEEGAVGTSDAVIIVGREIQAHDLKFGRGVKVFAERNKQLMKYALGALREFDLLGPFDRVRLVIHQPRLQHLDEWDCSIEELEAFAAEVRCAADAGRNCFGVQDLRPHLNPGEEQCRWCPGKAICPALAEEVSEVTGANLHAFEDLTQLKVPTKPITLAASMKKVGLVEDWCKAVRAELERQLFAGVEFNDWKLVMGKKGARAWNNTAEVADLMRKTWRMKVEQVFEMSLRTPPAIEKVLAKGNPKRWAKLQPFIGQSDGKPSVAPADDKRDPWVPSAGNEDFTDLTATPPETTT